MFENCRISALLFLIGLCLFPLLGAGQDVSDTSEETPDLISPDALMSSRIYAMDRRLQNVRIEIEALKLELTQALKENKLEQVKDLTDKINLREKTIKDIRVELDILINGYQRDFSRRDWWHKLMVEIGPQYTFFDNDLKINDVSGVRLRIHLRQDTFGRYHTYPFIETAESPIRELVSSPLIIEYRNSSHDVEGQTGKGRVDTYLAGFGLTGQLKQKSFIHLSLMGGIQEYSDMAPKDTGLIFSYSIGLQQQFSNAFALGLTATEDWVVTKATQPDHKTKSFFNFSFSLLARIKF
jgi:hypothetical protein